MQLREITPLRFAIYYYIVNTVIAGTGGALLGFFFGFNVFLFVKKGVTLVAFDFLPVIGFIGGWLILILAIFFSAIFMKKRFHTSNINKALIITIVISEIANWILYFITPRPSVTYTNAFFDFIDSPVMKFVSWIVALSVFYFLSLKLLRPRYASNLL